MGYSVSSVQLRGVSVAEVLTLAADAFRAEGWRMAKQPGPRTAELAAASSGDWTSLRLPRRWSPQVVDRIIESSGVPGIHLYVVDSDFWGGALFRDGKVVRRFDTHKWQPAARALRKQIMDTLGIDISEERLAEVLASKPTYAEESMHAFARLLSLENACDLPDEGVTTLLIERPESSLEAQLTGMLDMHAHALVLVPAVGFGAAVIDLLRFVAGRCEGLHLGSRNVLAAGGLITTFTEEDLPAIEARLDVGEFDSVSADFDLFSFNCRRHGNDGRHLQIVARELITADGQLTRPDGLGLLDPSRDLLFKLFVATSATVGLIDPVWSDTTRAATDLRSLVTWPPVAHWVSYLSPRVASKLGGEAGIMAAIGGWRVSQLQGGGILARLIQPAYQSRNTKGEQARAALTRVLAALPFPTAT